MGCYPDKLKDHSQSQSQPQLPEIRTNSKSKKNGMDTILADNARRKVSLAKGYSLMDWIRYSKGTPNIAGNNGVQRKITLEELAKHNKEDDCWTAIYGKINVKPKRCFNFLNTYFLR